MLHLLNTSWLFALTALSIPLIIHLWNIRQGKVLRVGSIALIAAASKKSSRSFRFTDVWLMLVRCALLAVIALLLTWPVWQKRVPATKSKGWVLMPREDIGEVYARFKPQLDSLHKAGYELHEFKSGFALIDSVKLRQLQNSRLTHNRFQVDNYWMLLNRLNSRISSATPVYLYTTNQLQHFTGAKPAVALNLHWQTYAAADSVSTWPALAWLTANSGIRVVTGTSRPSGTSFNYYTISNSPGQHSPFEINTDTGKLSVKLKNNASAAIPVDTATMRFAIYTDVNTTDVSYIKAVLQTVMQFSQRKFVIKQYINAGLIPAHQSWVFWLSERPVPARLQQAAHVLYYAPGKAVNVSSWVNTSPQFQLTDDGAKINLYKRVQAESGNGEPMWTDVFGNPVLSMRKQGSAQLYSFNSRFNPNWNELVWSERFPQLLFKLILAAQPEYPEHDRRTISYLQMLPLKGSSAYTNVLKVSRETDLRFALWLLAALLFLTERLMAHRTSTQTNHG